MARARVCEKMKVWGRAKACEKEKACGRTKIREKENDCETMKVCEEAKDCEKAKQVPWPTWRYDVGVSPLQIQKTCRHLRWH